MTAKLVEAIKRQGQPPCATCERWQWCAEKRMACAQFAAYVVSGSRVGRSRVPSRKKYKLVFGRAA